MYRVFKPRKGVFEFVISSIFIRFIFYTLRTDWMKMNSFNFLNYHDHGRDVCKQASVGIR